MRKTLPLMVLAFVPSVVSAELYECRDPDGCTARITEDGELQEVDFRKGDMVDTEAGWYIDTQDGWRKVRKEKPSPPIPQHRRRPWWWPFPGLVVGPGGHVGPIGLVPRSISIIGL